MGAHVLVVEDDLDLRDAMTAFLSHYGYEVVPAGSGNEALEQLRHGPRPQLMLLDLLMPDGTGLDVLAAMTADPALAVQTIVVTSWHRSRVPAGTRMIPKPFDHNEFLGAVQVACERP